jgi:hypothetical protein
MDKPVVNSFTKVIQIAKMKGLLTEDEVRTCLYLLAVLERPIVDIRKEMEEQPRLRAAVGYVFRTVEHAATEIANEVEKLFLRVYNSIYKVKYGGNTGKKVPGFDPSTIGRFSDKLIMAQCLQDPNFVLKSDEAESLKGLAKQFSELKDAYNARTRFLEQIANHERFSARQDKEEANEG